MKLCHCTATAQPAVRSGIHRACESSTLVFVTSFPDGDVSAVQLMTLACRAEGKPCAQAKVPCSFFWTLCTGTGSGASRRVWFPPNMVPGLSVHVTRTRESLRSKPHTHHATLLRRITLRLARNEDNWRELPTSEADLAIGQPLSGDS